MNGQSRRQKIMEKLKQAKGPVSGTELAKELGVSRQVIVQDMALIRANGVDVFSTHKGYVIPQASVVSRVFKVFHTEEQVEEELNLYVDLGGKVEDVFVYHKIHGVIKVPMNIKSRMDVKNYLKEIASGKSTQLMKLTSNYHYHTIIAENESILDMIQEELLKKGFLAKLQDYEPVDFWNK